MATPSSASAPRPQTAPDGPPPDALVVEQKALCHAQSQHLGTGLRVQHARGDALLVQLVDRGQVDLPQSLQV